MPFRWSPALSTWTMPWLMGWVNDKAVRRTNLLLGWQYGCQFQYREDMAAPNLPVACIASACYFVLLAVCCMPGGRALLSWLSPAQSQTPPEKRAAYQPGCFELTFQASTPRARAIAVVRGIDEPAFAETAKMLGESAVVLATRQPQLARETGVQGGILTPALMGTTLVDRLREKGMTFEVRDA